MTSESSNTAGKGKEVKKGKVAKRIAIIVSCVIVIPVVAVLVYFHIRYSQVNQAISTGSQDDLQIETEDPSATNVPDVDPNDIKNVSGAVVPPISIDGKSVNILLLGVDTRNPSSFVGRTDSMMVVNINTDKKTVKLVSIMRDTLVAVPGHDLNRINTVFEFDGPQATMDIIKKYYGIKIDYYAVVNFWAIADVIDTMGGVQINVAKDEVAQLNKNVDESNKYSTGAGSPHIAKSGMQELNGTQAVAYMRIRHVGNADFQRTDRQRTVMESLAKSDRSLLEVLGIVNKLPNYVRTNANELQMASIAKAVYDFRTTPIEQLRLPVDSGFKYGRYKGMSILVVDFIKNASALQDFLNK